MIGAIFELGPEVIEVRLNMNNIFFRTSNNQVWATIEGLQLDYSGVIKEHPDLEKNPDWKKEAVKRFKKKLREYTTEEEKLNYIIKDLKKFGYIPKYKQREGFRPEKII